MAETWKYSKHGGSALLVLLAVGDHTNGTGLAWPGIKLLAEKTKLSERQVRRVLKILENSGELEILRDRRYHRYRINLNHDNMSTVDKMSDIDGEIADIQGEVEDIQEPIVDTQGTNSGHGYVPLIINNHKETINGIIKESDKNQIFSQKEPALEIWEKLLNTVKHEKSNVLNELSSYHDVSLNDDTLTVWATDPGQAAYLNDRTAKTLERMLVGIVARSIHVKFSIKVHEYINI